MKVSNTVLIGAFAVVIVVLSIFVFLFSKDESTQVASVQESNANYARVNSPESAENKSEDESKNSFEFNEEYIKKAKAEQERLKKLELDEKAKAAATLAASEAKKESDEAEKQKAQITQAEIKEIKADNNETQKAEKIEAKSKADASIKVVNTNGIVEILRPIKKDITLYPDRSFKYKMQIYQKGDMFLDTYKVLEVSGIAIRFKDRDWAYSLRFVGDEK